MWNKKVLAFIVLAAVSIAASAQAFPNRGDDLTTSLGSFTIQVNGTFAPLFNGCPGFDATTNKFKSPTLFDQATRIGRSAAIKDGDPLDTGGVAVGTDGTIIREGMLFPPTDFPCGTIA